MKHLLKLRLLLGLSVGIMAVSASFVYADGCDGIAACQVPETSGLTGPSKLVSQFTGLNIKNSRTATANATNTWYWFFATTATAPSTATGSPEFSPDLGGNRVKADSNLTEFNSSPAPSDLLTNAKISTLLANTSYNIYAQACQANDFNVADPTHVACSDWILVFANQVTQILPPNPFNTVGTVDVSSGSLTVHTTVPDFTEVQSASITIHNAQGTGADGTLPGIAFTNNGILNIGYNGTPQSFPAGYPWIPNTQYTYAGQLIYPHNQRTTTENVASFYTRPTEPGPITIPLQQVTHCSAVVTVANANATPANPSYTDYHACTSGFDVSCLDQVIGGTGLQSDTTTFIFTHLSPGQTYGVNAITKNENASWLDSARTTTSTYTFTTLGFVGTFGVDTIGTNTANFKFLGLDLSGVVSYNMVINGVVGPLVNSVPVSPIALSGLTPNTKYDIQIQLNEASCSSIVPPTPATAGTEFYTLPTAPTGGSLGSTPTSVLAGWTDAAPIAGNPTGSTYSVNYCLDAGFSTGCHTQSPNPAKGGSTSIATTITASIASETTYYVEVKTIGLGGTDSAYLVLGSTETGNARPVVTSSSCDAVTGTATTCHAQATDNGPLTQLVCHWSVDGGATPPTINQAANSSGVCPDVNFSFPGTGSYTVTLIVQDHNGTGDSSNPPTTISVNVGTTASTIEAITPGNGTLVVGFTRSYSTKVDDAFGTPISGQGVNWTASPGVSLDPTHITNSTFTLVTAVDSLHNPVTLTAALPGLTSQTVTLTINASGPQITSGFPTLVLNNDGIGITGNLACAATDNSPGATALQYAWSLESAPTGAATPTYSDNNSNSASSSVVTFYKAGTYVLRCTASDNFGSAFATTPSTAVPQNLATLTVSPKTVTVKTLQGQAFTATGKDQFGDTMPLQSVAWTNSGGSLSSNSGSVTNFNSPSLGQNIKVVATSQGKSDFATVTVIDFNVGGAFAYPVPFKSTRDQKVCFANIGTTAKLRIYTTTGREVYTTTFTNVNSVPPACEAFWDTKNSSGDRVASGVYFYFVESPEGKKDGKLIIIQ